VSCLILGASLKTFFRVAENSLDETS
jgi:hypothetical protein